MDQRTTAAKAWADAESALRAKYHGAGLYVRKQVYQRPDGVTMVVGGWAYLDGDPAMIPTDLDLLVVSADSSSGQLEPMGRDPQAVLRILGAHVTRETSPVEHYAVRVPEAARPGLLAQIRALPEHTPGAAPAGGGAFGTPAPAPFGGPAYAAPVAPPMTAAPATSGGSGAAWIIGGIVGVVVLLALGVVCIAGGMMFVAARSEPVAVYEPEPYYPEYEPPPIPAPEPAPAAVAPAGDRYELPVPARAPTRGPASATVTIQVFSDFQCPFCSRVRPTLDQITQTYPRDVRIVWRNYPLPFHRDAMPAAEAALEVYEQAGDTAFWRYHDLLFENQRALGEADLVRYAGQIQGVNASQVSAALRDHRHRARVQEDMNAVQSSGMRIGTPSFLINGELVSGAQPFPRFQTAIEAAGGRG